MSVRRWIVAWAWATTMGGCGRGDVPAHHSEANSTRDARIEGKILVSAAASLTDAFTEIEAEFEATHPGTDVLLNLGGSSALRAQILDGAPADVFASANEQNMDEVVEGGRVSGEPHVIARNLLEIAVPSGNPAGITGLDDFSDEALRIGLCAAQVPCGGLALEILGRAGVTAAVDTNEPNARALLTKIELGELDAGITYATDVMSTGGAVEGIDVPDAFEVVATYWIALLNGAPNPRAAEVFMSFVASERGRAVLARHGFGLP